MKEYNKYLTMTASALCICFLSTEVSARSAAYHPENVTHSSNMNAGATHAQPAQQTTGVWEKTKEVSSDVWDGTKEVTSDVWDGTKKVTSDVWDGTKKVGGDVSDALSDDNTVPRTETDIVQPE